MKTDTFPKKVILFFLPLLLFSFSIKSFGIGGEGHSMERLFVLDFQTLDEKGDPIDPIFLDLGETISLSKIMSMGIVSRLVQYGQFQVEDTMSLKGELKTPPYNREETFYEQAWTLLTDHCFHQVIGGTIVPLQNTVIVNAQRYILGDEKPLLVGSAMAQAPSIKEVPPLVDTLLSQLFPSQVQVIERPIHEIYVVPSKLRLNLGASYGLNVYALDNKGRLVEDPLFLFMSHDEARIHVSEAGVVTALQPGTAMVTVRGLTHTAGSGPPTTLTVVTIPPAIGLRVGGIITDTKGLEGIPIKFGLRFTPSFDGGAKAVAPEGEVFTDSTNPLAIVSSFFSSLLTSGMMTFDLDFDPNKEMLFVLSGVQRSKTGYLGTGFGYVTPLGEEEHQGFTFRFTAGTQMQSTSRVSLPIELVFDMIFPADTLASPIVRAGFNIGLDLFP